MTINQALGSILASITGSSTQVGDDVVIPFAKEMNPTVRISFENAEIAQAFQSQYGWSTATVNGNVVSIALREDTLDIPLPDFTYNSQTYGVMSLTPQTPELVVYTWASPDKSTTEPRLSNFYFKREESYGFLYVAGLNQGNEYGAFYTSKPIYTAVTRAIA